MGCGSNSSFQGTSSLAGSDGGTEEADDDTLACAQKSDDGSDSDCVALGKPRKLDCASEKELEAAKAAGCVAEDPDDRGDFDACCPKSVRGTMPPSRTLACRQKADALDEKECGAFAGKPKKLDCGTTANVDSAIAAGCVRQKVTSSDVCCPSTVNGTPE